MCQPPGFAGSGSGSAQTASSKSRASLSSIVTSASSRRSAPACRGGGQRRLRLRQRRGGKFRRDVVGGDDQPTDRARCIGRPEPFEDSGALAEASRRQLLGDHQLAVRQAGRVVGQDPVLAAVAAVGGGDDAALQRAAEHADDRGSPRLSRRRMISASISPLSLADQPGQHALADARVRRPRCATRRKLGASPSPAQPIGRAVGKPSGSLPDALDRQDVGQRRTGGEPPVAALAPARPSARSPSACLAAPAGPPGSARRRGRSRGR